MLSLLAVSVLRERNSEAYMPRAEPVTMAVRFLFCVAIEARVRVFGSRTLNCLIVEHR